MIQPRSHKTIIIIAGGPSVRHYDVQQLKGLGYILAVNDSFIHAPYDAIVSMDGRWMFNRYKAMREAEAKLFASHKHFAKWCSAGWVWPGVDLFKVDPDGKGLSNSFDLVHANNSGFMALNLAYLLKPENIFLYGFDLNYDASAGEKTEHWYGSYPWRGIEKKPGLYQMWIPNHKIAATQLTQAGIKVFNVSETSKLDCYPKMSFENAENLLRQLYKPK